MNYNPIFIVFHFTIIALLFHHVHFTVCNAVAQNCTTGYYGGMTESEISVPVFCQFNLTGGYEDCLLLNATSLGNNFTRVFGMSIDPCTKELYLLGTTTDSVTSRSLFKFDSVSLEFNPSATLIATYTHSNLFLAGLTFSNCRDDDTASLYGVTGVFATSDGGEVSTPIANIYEIDTGDGSLTLITDILAYAGGRGLSYDNTNDAIYSFTSFRNFSPFSDIDQWLLFTVDPSVNDSSVTLINNYTNQFDDFFNFVSLGQMLEPDDVDTAELEYPYLFVVFDGDELHRLIIAPNSETGLTGEEEITFIIELQHWRVKGLVCGFGGFLFPPTQSPTVFPTVMPTNNPTQIPTLRPSFDPTSTPTNNPTNQPTENPTHEPTQIPTFRPSFDPTGIPTNNPTVPPTNRPTDDPTQMPIFRPSQNPTNTPTNNPNINPTGQPTNNPSVIPSGVPSKDPTNIPTVNPAIDPTFHPTINPTKARNEDACCHARENTDSFEDDCNQLIYINHCLSNHNHILCEWELFDQDQCPWTRGPHITYSSVNAEGDVDTDDNDGLDTDTDTDSGDNSDDEQSADCFCKSDLSTRVNYYCFAFYHNRQDCESTRDRRTSSCYWYCG